MSAQLGTLGGRVLAALLVLTSVLVGGVASAPSAGAVPVEPFPGFVFNANYPSIAQFDTFVTSNLKFPITINMLDPQQVHTPEVNSANQQWRLLCALAFTRNADGSITDNPDWGGGAYCGSAPGADWDIDLTGFPGVEAIYRSGQVFLTGGCLAEPLGCEVSETESPTITITR